MRRDGAMEKRKQIGPYSRRLHRGSIGASIDGRSELGRFIRALEAALVAHVGGAPSIVQRLLIERLIKLQLQLDGLDAKLAGGEWTPHDGRTYGGILNAYRLTGRELGLKPAAASPLSLAERLRGAKRASFTTGEPR
jgi:hypothetical protein